MIAQEIQKLPDRHIAHPRRNRASARHGAADISAIEQIGRKEIPWLALRCEPLQGGGEPPETVAGLRRQAGQIGELVETLHRALLLIAQVSKSRMNVLKRDAIARQG